MKLPVKLASGDKGEESLPLHLPFDIVNYLICECHLDIDNCLLSNFWSHREAVGDNWALTTHEFRRVAGVVWPLGFYGDEAAMGLVLAPTNQVFGLFLNFPLFRPKSTRMSRYLIWSIESDKILSIEETVYPVLAEITASFNKLTETGVRGIRFLLSEIRGDQVFFHMIFKHKSWWKATNMCFRSKAIAGPGPFSYCKYELSRSNDNWNSTLRSTDDFIVLDLPEVKCTLFCHGKLTLFVHSVTFL